MANANKFDMATLLEADIKSVQNKSGVRETVSNIANSISQTANLVADVIELARYEIIDMKAESRQRLLEKYSTEGDK